MYKCGITPRYNWMWEYLLFCINITKNISFLLILYLQPRIVAFIFVGNFVLIIGNGTLDNKRYLNVFFCIFLSSCHSDTKKNFLKGVRYKNVMQERNYT